MSLKEILFNHRKILLVVPPIYDVRLPWSSWHQPTGLLQIAALLRHQGKDIKLIDCLYANNKNIARSKIGEIKIDGYTLNRWHFGSSLEKLRSETRKAVRDGWNPDAVFVTSLNSIWWEGVRDSIRVLRDELPGINIFLGGAYPRVSPEHAQRHSGADVIFDGPVRNTSTLYPELSIYSPVPYSAGIYFYHSRTINDGRKTQVRNIGSIVNEICQKVELGVREFVLFDEEIKYSDRDAFTQLLENIAERDLGARFILPGNISPKIITRDMATNLKRAGVKQIHFRCDLQFSKHAYRYITPDAAYERAMKLLVKDGKYKERDGNISAMYIIGLPLESLERVSEKLMSLAHIVGSIIPVPFQYVPGFHKGEIFDRIFDKTTFSPEELNGKLYLLGRLSGNSFEDYMEMTRLAALLNSKYRSRTFDFLGDGFVSKLFRDSIKNTSWDPFKNSELELKVNHDHKR